MFDYIFVSIQHIQYLFFQSSKNDNSKIILIIFIFLKKILENFLVVVLSNGLGNDWGQGLGHS